MSWDTDERFLRKRIQEQKDHIAWVKKCDLQALRELFVLESAEGQLKYFEGKLERLAGLLNQIASINASPEFLSNPKSIEILAMLVEGVNKMSTGCDPNCQFQNFTAGTKHVCCKTWRKVEHVKCGDCNKHWRCTTCDAPCGSEGHFIEK